MAELGQYAQVLHTELGVSIARAKVEVLLAVGKFARIAAEAAKRNADYNLQTVCFDDTPSACNNLQDFIKDYDIILIKGSRAAMLEMVTEKLKELYKKKHEARNSKSETNTNDKNSKFKT
jgi:UDP-N-acetylmuramoyl-tripeptide--D-alanyl-D-alanine ligase